MNKKFTRKLGAMTLATVLAFGGLINTANAAEPLQAAPPSIVKNLNLKADQEAYRPAVTRTFTITGEEATANSAPNDNTGKPINHNLIKAAPKGLVSFSKTVAKLSDNIVFEEGRGADSKSLPLYYDLGVLEDVPGIYRVRFTESGAERDGLTNDISRYMDLYVRRNEEDGKLYISSAVVFDDNGKKLDGKDQREVTTGEPGSGILKSGGSIVFNNQYDTVTKTITKAVEGDLGDRTKNKKFEFTVTIKGQNGEKYIYDSNISKKEGVQSDKEGNYVVSHLPFKVYLAHGEKVTIRGLTENDTITVTETENLVDTGYTQKGEVTDEKAGTKNSTITITNTFEQIIPTGLIDNVTPYIMVLSVAVVGGVVYLTVKKQRDSELA